MSKVIISSPESSHGGPVGGLTFANGQAEADTELHAAEIAYCRNAGYTVAEPEADRPPEPPKAPVEFDPAAHTVAEVQAHLADADDTERAHVLAAEKAGKNRAGITQQGASQ